jgi:hypothetical protein
MGDLPSEIVPEISEVVSCDFARIEQNSSPITNIILLNCSIVAISNLKNIPVYLASISNITNRVNK